MVCPDFRTGRPDFRTRVEAAKIERVAPELGWLRATKRPDFRTPNESSAWPSQPRCVNKPSNISKLCLARNSRRRSLCFGVAVAEAPRWVLLNLSGVTGHHEKRRGGESCLTKKP